MTHIFSASASEMGLLLSEQKKFDILRFNRNPSIGDTIIYQLEQLEPGEGEEKTPAQPNVPDEYTVKIDFIFDDTEGALKKGYHGVGFSVHA